MQIPLIYKSKPVFGFDMGGHTVKVVQIQASKKPRIVGYGSISFPPEIVVDGVVKDPELLAKSIRPLLKGKTTGAISATRVAASLPMNKIFSRLLKLPAMSKSDLDQAIVYEVEQYVPVPIKDLYLDYEVLARSEGKEGKQMLVSMVATPKVIVDSYLKLFELLKLEVASIETSIDAVTRALRKVEIPTGPVLSLDVGSRTTDIAIYETTTQLTSSIAMGGDNITQAMITKLGITDKQATEIKSKFGLGPSGLQAKVVPAIEEELQKIVTEVRKMIKFHNDQAPERKLTKLNLCGGSSQLPGLGEYLHSQLSLPVTKVDIWEQFSLGRLKPPQKAGSAIYTTAVGLALREIEK